ncbi:FecR domain-containing protein [Cohnella panacarvi]|uniref:FecR domain-containing protein n=1 Tax=Cohnella panacarvi TaxID=400776 RepID=UPI00047A08E4|nr:FecR domain-containing protein [Cohnella panacarvi]
MRQHLIRLLALLLVVVPLLGAWANETSAASTRVAVIKELKGTAKVKKAGGSKEFTAFAKMSLNEGDVLSVGSGGSAVLQFANGTSEDDKMTVGDNTKLTFSKLSNKKGTTTKVSMWSGSAWVDVKSIASKDDQFMLETPTAVMGVRGTHFMTVVDPLTGSTRLSVAGGIVSMTPPVPGGAVPPTPQLIYPSQSILTLTGGTGLPNNNLAAPVDPADLVNRAGSALIEAMLRASSEIQQENDRLMSQYVQDLAVQQSDLERMQNNIDNLVSVIVNQAIAAQLIQQAAIDRIQEELLRSLGKKIDLSIKELQLTVEERRKQEIQREVQRQAKEAAEKKLQEEAEARNKELMEKIKQKQEEQKKAAEEAIKKKQEQAYSKYESQLDEAGKKRLQENKQNLSQGQTPAPSEVNTGGGGGGSPSGSPSSEPYTNPLQSLRVTYKIYPESEGYSSLPPTNVDFDVPLGSVGSSYEYELPSSINYVELSLEKAAAFADYDVKISVNGKPYSYDEYYTEYDLTRARNEIAIEVKPHGQIATSANTKRFTLYVIKPSLPEGYNFTTTTDGGSLTWEPLGNGHFRAKATAAAVSEIAFNPTYNGSAVEGAMLHYYSENNEEIEIAGLTARNLVEGEVYSFVLSMGNTSLYFDLLNHVAEPDWEQFFYDNFEFREDHSEGPYVRFGNQNGEQYTEVSFSTKRLDMDFNGETEEGYFPLGGIWDEREWTYVPGDWSSVCGESDECDRLQQGDNRFILYVGYGGDINEHRYVLNIHRNDPLKLFDYALGMDSGLQDWYVGDRTWVIHALAHEPEIEFVTFGELAISGSSADGQIQLIDTEDVSVVMATYMDAPGEYLLNVNVTSIEEPDHTYSPYKFIIYNGFNIDFDEFKVDGLTYEGDLYVITDEDVTINSASVGMDKEIVGVFDRFGNAVPPISDGSYFLDESLYGQYYVVVRDTITNYKVTTVIDQQYYR